jgi:recombination protein RecA
MKKIQQLKNSLTKEGYNIQIASELTKQEKVRTGVYGLDYVLDGGISMSAGGHRIELFGAESSGKTTFALYIIKKFQELGKICAFMDTEWSYELNWGKMLGVNNDELLISHPDTLEQAGDLFVKIIPEVDLLVIDSINGLIPEGEANRDTAEVQMALSARVNSLITRKIYHAIANKNTTMIFINQMREKVGVMYGNPNTTPGGHALKHMYNTRVEFRAGKPIKEKDDVIGTELTLRCIKNKKGKPYHVAAVDFFLDGRIDNRKSLFYAGKKLSVIERTGNTYKFDDKTAIGEEKFLNAMTDKDWKKLEEKLWTRTK